MSRAELARAVEGARPVDAGLLAAARREQVTALLATRAVAVGEDVRRALELEHRLALARETVFERELRWTLRVLGAEGIHVLLLKGAALTRLVYRAGERPMSDLDVLIRPARWRAATRALLTAGARLHDPTDRPFLLGHYYNLPLLTPGGVVVEVHRRLCGWPLFAVDLESVFARASARDDEGGLLPDPNDLFVMLAVHAAKHGWEVPLRSYLDGALLLGSGLIDRGTVLDRARSWRASRATARWFALVAAPETAPRSSSPSGLGRRFLRVAGASDGLVRPLAWATSRLGYRLADRAVRLLRRRAG